MDFIKFQQDLIRDNTLFTDEKHPLKWAMGDNDIAIMGNFAIWFVPLSEWKLDAVSVFDSFNSVKRETIDNQWQKLTKMHDSTLLSFNLYTTYIPEKGRSHVLAEFYNSTKQRKIYVNKKFLKYTDFKHHNFYGNDTKNPVFITDSMFSRIGVVLPVNIDIAKNKGSLNE